MQAIGCSYWMQSYWMQLLDAALLDAGFYWMQRYWMQGSIGCSSIGCRALLDAPLLAAGSIGCTAIGSRSIGCRALLDAPYKVWGAVRYWVWFVFNDTARTFLKNCAGVPHQNVSRKKSYRDCSHVERSVFLCFMQTSQSSASEFRCSHCVRDASLDHVEL